jgi:hypothetical protein
VQLAALFPHVAVFDFELGAQVEQVLIFFFQHDPFSFR